MTFDEVYDELLEYRILTPNWDAYGVLDHL